MILGLYIARRFLRSFVLIAGVFLAILFLIDIIEQIRRFGDEGVGLAGVAFLAALNIASSFYTILPLVTLLAGISLFLGLSRSSELVAARAAGRSGLGIAAAPVLAAVLVGAICVAVLNPIVAGTSKRFDEAVDQVQGGGQQAVSLGDEGVVWLRQSAGGPSAGGAPGQIVIRASRASAEATTLYDATFIIFDADRGPVRRIDAQTARLTPGRWTLTGVKEWPLGATNPEQAAQMLPALTVATELTAARIREGFGAPEAVPIWQLPDFIAGLERAGFSGLRHRVWLMMELARPFLMGAMVAVAAAFTMRPARGRRTGLLALTAFASGVGLFFLRNLAQVLGEAGDVPSAMAAFAPVAVGGLLALAMLLRLEEG